jgi:hypothetical protein
MGFCCFAAFSDFIAELLTFSFLDRKKPASAQEQFDLAACKIPQDSF